MKNLTFNFINSALVSLGLLVGSGVFADDSALPEKPQTQSEVTQSVQNKVDEKSDEKVSEKRKKIISDAITAVNETKKALKHLEEKKVDDALEALVIATGKLELILAREPELAFAPIDVDMVTYDLLANIDTVKAMIHDAENYLEDGEIQKARPIVANLASEIQFRTVSIPLVSYPKAIKAITPLIDEGKLEEAKSKLQAALNTLVVTTEEVIPLPKMRAERMLKNAEELAENKERTEKDNETLAQLLQGARKQLKLGELLGYGSKKSFAQIYEQLDTIEAKTSEGKGGSGWFDKIKKQISNLI